MRSIASPTFWWDEIVISDGTSTSDRKSTRLNSSHTVISYAVFCLKKKNKHRYKFVLIGLYSVYSSLFRHDRSLFFFNDTATTEIYTLSLHDALPIFGRHIHV